MKNIQIILAIAVAIIIQAEIGHCGKILGFYSTPSQSHMIIHNALIYELANRGHDVTLVTSLKPVEKIPSNMRLIHLKTDDQDFMKTMVKWMNNDSSKSIWDNINFFSKTTEQHESMLVHPEFLAIKNETFDLVILGWFFNDFQIGVAEHFKAPLILSASMKPLGILQNYVGNPSSVATVPTGFFAMKLPMSFIDRVINFVGTGIEQTMITIYHQFFAKPRYEKYFPSDQYRSYEEAQKNVALVLVSHHFSQGVPHAYLPGMIEVGGMHIKSNPQPLPENIKDWLGNATDGAVFFSLGSNAKSTLLPAVKLKAIMRSFARISPVRVLFKWEDDQLPNKPDNVMIGKWMPQSDILAHPNIKLFISHCGLGSVNEAKHHGVPILGMPIFADQPTNFAKIVADGWGLGASISNTNEENFSAALIEMIRNSTYGDTVKKMSTLFRDRPQHPLDTAVYWTEYVLRHKGAKHMQSPAVHLNFFQYNSLDVIGFILLSVYIVFKLIKWAVCSIIGKCKSKGKKKTE